MVIEISSFFLINGILDLKKNNLLRISIPPPNFRRNFTRLQIFSPAVRFIQKKISLSLVLRHRSFLTNTRFFSQPVCNLIKREVSKSTKESSIDLCATRRPTRIDFSLHFSAARKKFDCPD